jgi:hypothetical protein
MAKAAYYTVSTSFIGSHEGGGIEYHKGEVVDGDDPALKRWPEYFEPLLVREHLAGKKAAPVEQATAAPGEKRSYLRRKPRKATAAEESAIAATVEAEAEPQPAGKAITTAGFKGR